jgi:peptide/nickel transport system permease protein
MARYILQRVLLAIPTLILVSMISFAIIQLPPGDYLTSYIAQVRQSEGDAAANQLGSLVVQLRAQYGLDQPIHVQYYRWVSNILLRGDFGYSFEQKMPVNILIWERLVLTVVLTGTTLIFTWLLAIPIGVLSATRQYSIGDYFFTFLSFVGLGIPNFLIALILMWIAFRYFNTTITGLFSPEYANAPWSLAKFGDLMSRIWLAVVVLGLGGTASLIRTIRANLLDELNKPYVEAARAKGLTERELIWKYPVRLALNPFISSVGWALPQLISGATIVSIVLNLPTTGPLLLRSLLAQDMYLAGSFVLMLSVLTVVGMLISDILLALMDPRIVY